MSESVVEYYTEHYSEASRHRNDAFGIIQEIRTKELFSRHLGKGKRSILDVGGATGIYSFYLAERGHDVSLLDIVPDHIDQVKKINGESNAKLKDIILGDARSFETEDRYDVIIIHGPLYHITDREERLNELIAETFIEFGASGNVYNKELILESLPNQEKTHFEMFNFSLRQLENKTVLATYSIEKDSIVERKKTKSLLSSIWQFNIDRWQIIFHQGTPQH